MKKLLTMCLLIATSFTVNAQDKKPTEEEIIDYILTMMNTVTEIRLIYQESPGREGYVFYKYEEQDVKTYFENCTLYFTESQFGGISRNYERTDNVKIDFSKVELVYQAYKNGIDGDKISGGEIIHCKLVEKIDGKSKIKYLPLYTYDAQKVMKALNHLRKLCGAPDPISFD
ncbi:hypothetical protein FBBAL38_11779 [Flavobacteria bacterium BAL38]|nr:hypothetical protein FBBAL38_11779 [Flavobacteria bacterium BAL38]